MLTRAAPSPAWLGTAAVVSFAALVLIAFASGYHLVAGESTGAVRGAAVQARTAIVRPNLAQDRARLRREPNATAEAVVRLPAAAAVTIVSENADWVQVRYERQGEAFEGWTERANLDLR